MSRKRSISSLIDDDQESTSRQPSLSQRSHRNRSISSLIDDIDEDQESSSSQHSNIAISSIIDEELPSSPSQHHEYQDSQGTFSAELHQFEISKLIKQKSDDYDIELAIDDNEFDLNLLFQHYIRSYTNHSKIADNRCGRTLEYTTENDRFTDSSISSNESDDKPATTEIFEDYSPSDYEPF